MPRLRWGIAPAIASALVLAGCGSSGHSDTAPRLTRAQADALVAQLGRARATATAHDLAGTEAALHGFTRQVGRLRRAGALSDSTARALRIGAARALARARSDSATAQPTTTTPAPAPPPAAKEKKKEPKGHGKGKGHGEEGDE